MRQKSTTPTSPSEQLVKSIRRATSKHYSAEEKIRIVLDGLRGESSIAELCRREGIAEGLYYSWSKEFLEAGKRRLAGDTARAATSSEVTDLRREARALKEVVPPTRRRAVSSCATCSSRTTAAGWRTWACSTAWSPRSWRPTIAGEGWKWIEVAVDFPYGHTHRTRKLKGAQADVSADEQATIDALNAEHARLQAEYHNADELPDEVDQRLGEIETELAAFDDRPVTYDPAEITRAGAFISIDGDGRLSVDRGHVRPEDEHRRNADGQETEHADSGTSSVQSPCTAVDQGTVITFGHQSEVEAEEDEAIRPLPERLLMELTAHRTLALRDAVANDPHVAMTALLHKLCLDAFEHSVSPACLKASVGHVFFAVQASDLRDTASAKAVAERHEAWKAELPTEEGALWDWLAVLDDDRRTQLLAHCVSFGINALHERPGRYGADPTDHGLRSRLAQADRLAQAVGLDMVAAGWRPTVENYLGRVTKPRILEAVHEARGEQAAQLIDHLKKGDMAKEAERLLDGTGWLPEPLRIAAAAPATDEPSAQGDALPEFLTSDDATADASEERAQQAAE
jgi:ParB family chromosome partitioning protein